MLGVAPLLDRKRFYPNNLVLLASSSPRSFLGVAVSRQTPHKHKSEDGDYRASQEKPWERSDPELKSGRRPYDEKRETQR